MAVARSNGDKDIRSGLIRLRDWCSWRNRTAPKAKVARDGSVIVIAFSLLDVTVKANLNAKNRVVRVETPLSGISYSDCKDLGEVEKQRGATVLDLTITKVDANDPYAVFPVPEAVERSR